MKHLRPIALKVMRAKYGPRSENALIGILKSQNGVRNPKRKKKVKEGYLKR